MRDEGSDEWRDEGSEEWRDERSEEWRDEGSDEWREEKGERWDGLWKEKMRLREVGGATATIHALHF